MNRAMIAKQTELKEMLGMFILFFFGAFFFLAVTLLLEMIMTV